MQQLLLKQRYSKKLKIKYVANGVVKIVKMWYSLDLNTFERVKTLYPLYSKGLESLLINLKMRDFFIFLFVSKFFLYSFH